MKSPYAGKAKRGGLAFSLIILPFSLPPYPLPLSTPATQATANALHSSGMGVSGFPGALRPELACVQPPLHPGLTRTYEHFATLYERKGKKLPVLLDPREQLRYSL